jgi:hypothetical protein
LVVAVLTEIRRSEDKGAKVYFFLKNMKHRGLSRMAVAWGVAVERPKWYQSTEEIETVRMVVV